MTLDRNKTLDNYKFILISLVVIRHVLQTSTSDSGGVISNLIWAIQMPGFMVLSGYFAVKEVPTIRDAFRNIAIKMSRYLLPFISWYTLVNILLLNRVGNIRSAYSALLYNVDIGLWFLWVLFVLGVISTICDYILTKTKKIVSSVLKICLLGVICVGMLLAIAYRFSLSFLGIKYILYYAIYYAIGYILGKEKNGIKKYLNGNSIVKDIIYLCCAVIFMTIIFKFDLFKSEDTVLSIFIRLTAALSGCIWLYNIIVKFTSLFIQIHASDLGKYTIEVYCVHVFVCSLMKVDSGYSLYSINGSLNALIALIFTIGLTTIIIIAIKSIKILNFVMFGKQEKIVYKK